MSDQQPNQQPSGEGVAYERCLCRELLDQVRAHLGVSPAVKQHLINSRVEFLKAVRRALDDRIEHLSNKAAQGTKIAVE
jgi:hypothetical protein